MALIEINEQKGHCFDGFLPMRVSLSRDFGIYPREIVRHIRKLKTYRLESSITLPLLSVVDLYEFSSFASEILITYRHTLHGRIII